MTVISLDLPTKTGEKERYQLADAIALPRTAGGNWNRVAFAAVHVVSDPLADLDPWLDVAIDWEATLRYREYLWDLGFGVAEAMDTAQRGMGLDWENAKLLIRRSLQAAANRPDRLIASGAGTDHLIPDPSLTIDDVIAAYEEQVSFVEDLGGQVILMASRALAKIASSPDDYITVYDRILSQAAKPVIIHWLGEMFDPSLAGYWGFADHDKAMDVALSIISAHSNKVDGIKISLLSKQKEIDMRRRLPSTVRMYTGDDFNYAELIAGDELGYSDALLGIFDGIAPAASKALSALSDGSPETFYKVLEPTIPLSKLIFKEPTRFYKTGIVLLAYLNGHQDHFSMIGGQESARSTLHLAEIFRLADRAGILLDPDLAANRMQNVLNVRGFE